EDRVLFFPSSYRRAIKYNQKDAANMILRTEVLTRVHALQTDGTPLFIVTYPDALAERVMSEKQLEGSTIDILVGNSYDVMQLEKDIISLGFCKTDYVYEPGQFALRGSILDVFSFSADQPYRIDFFGDEVDSIRTFDIQSQLSEKKVEQMTVVAEMATEAAEYISFLEFLPHSTLTVTKSLTYVCDRIAIIHNEGFSLQAKVEADAKEDELFSNFIIDTEDFVRQISAFRHLEIKSNATDNDDSVHFHTEAQPLFHKNFDLVSAECHRLTSSGYAICIFADSEKQIKRLQSIFEEMAQTEVDHIHFSPVNHSIHEGFIDHDTRRAFFTDHQIFDRFHKYNLKSDKARNGKVALTLKELQQFDIGDYVVHIDHGIGRFGGLVRVPQGDVMQEMIKIIYRNDDTVYVSIHALHK
ncbi:MAG: CarD family transcriptional regulator, partial [Bacteroidales bacterium]|nr:CarD family transcriptional regulator [Bacteroidales bacterium]